MLRGLAVLVGLGLTLYALIDCIRTDGRQVQALPKAVWVFVILVLPVIGPLAWILAGRSRTPPGPVVGRGPVAPDDDPEFLRQLERSRRQKAQEERLRRREEELRRREEELRRREDELRRREQAPGQDGEGAPGPDNPDDADRQA